MSWKRRGLAVAGVWFAVAAGWTGLAAAQGRSDGAGALTFLQDLADQLNALQTKVEEIFALSDLDCPNNYPLLTFPGLAVNRYGEWDCALPVYVEEEVEVAVGDRHAYGTARCPSPLLPISGGTGAKSWSVPPDTGSLVLADSGWGPDVRDWHARWVSLSTGGATATQTLTVGVFCL